MKAHWSLPLLGAAVMALFGIGLFWGPAHLEWSEEWAALQGRGGETAGTIMWQLRLPRLVTATLSGAALGLAGLLMQTFFRNPLAGPGVLGVSSGATLGVALVALGGASIGSVSGTVEMGPQVVGALIGGGAVMALLGLVMGRFRSRTALLIFGLMVGYLAGALVTVLQAGAEAGALQAFVHWGMGSFAHAGWASCTIMLCALTPAIFWSWKASNSLDMWTMGALTAKTMGVDERALSWSALGTAGILAALVTAWCGPVAFLGLATPHLVRAAGVRGRHSTMLWPVVLTGATVALLADLVVRLAGVPLNAVLSLVGAPVVLMLIVGRGRILSKLRAQ
ncbi:MAG: iron ABC transporter permease [Flavobacteriales bacterium]|nr:iron ABC transporter permease [Flavobacteriales bacterium]